MDGGCSGLAGPNNRGALSGFLLDGSLGFKAVWFQFEHKLARIFCWNWLKNMLLLEVATEFILYVVAIEVSANHHDCWNKRTWSMDINAFHANLGHIVNIGYPTFDPMKCHRFTFIKSLTRFQHHNPFDKKVSIFSLKRVGMDRIDIGIKPLKGCNGEYFIWLIW